MDELKQLKAEHKDKLYTFIETLAFHPNSKVNMKAVVNFWQQPEAYFNAVSSHVSEEVQNRKKPSNLIHMPNLDLSAEQLRDAIVEGLWTESRLFHLWKSITKYPWDRMAKQ